MDSSRVRQREKEKKKFQRSNIENKMEYGGDYKEGYCGERKVALKIYIYIYKHISDIHHKWLV